MQKSWPQLPAIQQQEGTKGETPPPHDQPEDSA